METKELSLYRKESVTVVYVCDTFYKHVFPGKVIGIAVVVIVVVLTFTRVIKYVVTRRAPATL